jgi:Spy/CpxP family protein refolding chaperone
VSQWKVILAALVIFGSGVITGGLLVKNTLPQKTSIKRKEPNAPTPWIAQRLEFHKRIEKELDLQPEQKQKIEQVFRESQDRMKPLWEKISPQLHEEIARVQDEIRTQLSPEQGKKFDELLKARPRKQEKTSDEKRRRKKETNSPPASVTLTNQ